MASKGAKLGQEGGRNDSILDLIFIQGIPRQGRNFEPLSTRYLSFGVAVRNAKKGGEEAYITADHAAVRLHAAIPLPSF